MPITQTHAVYTTIIYRAQHRSSTKNVPRLSFLVTIKKPNARPYATFRDEFYQSDHRSKKRKRRGIITLKCTFKTNVSLKNLQITKAYTKKYFTLLIRYNVGSAWITINATNESGPYPPLWLSLYPSLQ